LNVILFSNGEGIEHSVGTCVAFVTVYIYSVTGDIHHAEVIGIRIIVHVPGGFDD